VSKIDKKKYFALLFRMAENLVSHFKATRLLRILQNRVIIEVPGPDGGKREAGENRVITCLIICTVHEILVEATGEWRRLHNEELNDLY
jgi:hypothetical protein